MNQLFANSNPKKKKKKKPVTLNIICNIQVSRHLKNYLYNTFKSLIQNLPVKEQSRKNKCNVVKHIAWQRKNNPLSNEWYKWCKNCKKDTESLSTLNFYQEKEKLLNQMHVLIKIQIFILNKGIKILFACFMV